MIAYWSSVEKLTYLGLKVAWLGIAVSCLGLLLPGRRWIAYLGLATTAVGLLLRHRAEHLKRLETAPRHLTESQKLALRRKLEHVPKTPLIANFLGHDTECRSFAQEIKDLLESAGFPVQDLSGFVEFEPRFGLHIMVFKGGKSDPMAEGICDAFGAVGLGTKLETNKNQMEVSVAFQVHRKPSQTRQ